MSKQELKTCPFCLKQPITEQREYIGTVVRCDNPKCGMYSVKPLRLDDWNTRPAPVEAECVRLAETISGTKLVGLHSTEAVWIYRAIQDLIALSKAQAEELNCLKSETVKTMMLCDCKNYYRLSSEPLCDKCKIAALKRQLAKAKAENESLNILCSDQREMDKQLAASQQREARLVEIVKLIPQELKVMNKYGLDGQRIVAEETFLGQSAIQALAKTEARG